MDFGKLLAQLRRQRAADLRRDISPADIARHMGISRAAYNHWEKGRRRPKDVGVYRRLAAYLGVGLNDLGVNIDDMAAEPERKVRKAPEIPAPDTRKKQRAQGGS